MQAIQSIADLHAHVLTQLGPDPVMYDLGCGQQPEEGFIGLDKFATEKPGLIRCDLFHFPWTIYTVEVKAEDDPTNHLYQYGRYRQGDSPIPAGSVDYLTSSHFVEHVPDWSAHFAEAYRVLKPGGFYKLTAPYHTSDRADQDPDHKQRVLEARFWYLSRDWLKANKIDHCNPNVNFSLLGETFFYAYNQAWAGRAQQVLDEAKQKYRNVVDDIALILRKEA